MRKERRQRWPRVLAHTLNPLKQVSPYIFAPTRPKLVEGRGLSAYTKRSTCHKMLATLLFCLLAFIIKVPSGVAALLRASKAQVSQKKLSCGATQESFRTNKVCFGRFRSLDKIVNLMYGFGFAVVSEQGKACGEQARAHTAASLANGPLREQGQPPALLASLALLFILSTSHTCLLLGRRCTYLGGAPHAALPLTQKAQDRTLRRAYQSSSSSEGHVSFCAPTTLVGEKAAQSTCITSSRHQA